MKSWKGYFNSLFLKIPSFFYGIDNNAKNYLHQEAIR